MQKPEFENLFYSIKKSCPSDPKPDIVQSPEELWWLFSAVQNIKPKVILEIGTEFGGTSWFWEKTLSEDGLLLTIDIVEHDRSPGKFCDFSAARAKVIFHHGVNSQLPESVDGVKNLLGGKEVDFLYIDGDHSYEGVKKDYELWTPLVRPGGLVGFHDTNHPPIRKLLLEKNHPNLEMIDHGFGTGLIRGR